jgi:hypothetical protein
VHQNISPTPHRLQQEKEEADLLLRMEGDGEVSGVTVRNRLLPPQPLNGRETAVTPKANKRVLALGLNAALQRVIRLKGLELGGVNRAESVTVGIGGKGQNFGSVTNVEPSYVGPLV